MWTRNYQHKLTWLYALITEKNMYSFQSIFLFKNENKISNKINILSVNHHSSFSYEKSHYTKIISTVLTAVESNVWYFLKKHGNHISIIWYSTLIYTYTNTQVHNSPWFDSTVMFRHPHTSFLMNLPCLFAHFLVSQGCWKQRWRLTAWKVNK